MLYFLVYFALRQKIELLATPKCPTYICTLLRQQERKGSSSTTLAIKLFLLGFLLHRIELCCNICNIATVNAMLLGQIIAAKRRRCARGGALHKCITWWRLTSPAPPFKAPVYVQDFLEAFLSLSLHAKLNKHLLFRPLLLLPLFFLFLGHGPNKRVENAQNKLFSLRFLKSKVDSHGNLTVNPPVSLGTRQRYSLIA